jgi:GH35 family endo-1,4-beta-xylanase
MKAKILVLLAVQLVLAQTTVGLKDVYSSYFKFGSILNGGKTANNTDMKNAVLREFNSITPENELKPDATLLKSGSTNTDVKVQLNSGAKAILQFCQDNNIPVRGHTLVWHSQTPNWFFRENFSDNGALVSITIMNQRMESYIKNMFAIIKSSYPTLNLYAYDVVNEAAKTSDSGPRSPCNSSDNTNCGDNSMWVKVYGDNSFIEKAFTYARQYAPATTKLFYNDFNEYIVAKRDYIATSIVKPLYDKGLLDGMGMQSHLDVRGGNDAWPSANEYGAAVKKYKDIGVDIHITELDATINNGDRTKFQAQAQYYKDIMNAIISNGGSSVKAVVVWGIRDDQSWRADRTPLLFEGTGNTLTKKPAYDALVSIVPESNWGKPASRNSGGGNSSSSGGNIIQSSSSGGATPSSSSSAPVQATTCKTPLVEYPTSVPADPYTACFKYTNDKCYVCKVDNESSENGYYCSSGWVWNGTQIETNLEQGYWYYEVECPGTTPILNSNSLPLAASSPLYYSLKGEPLGNAKPQKAGVYIIKQGYSVKKIAVR